MPRIAIALAAMIILAAPRDAQAYLDPATGSAIIQMLVAGVMGALFVVRLYWRKIKSVFTGQPPADPETPGGQSATGDERE